MKSQAELVVNLLIEELAQKIKENAVLKADLMIAQEQLRKEQSDEHQ